MLSFIHSKGDILIESFISATNITLWSDVISYDGAIA